jgi:hypothetical protein
MSNSELITFQPGEFDSNKHYYQKVINAQIHPLIRYFMNLSSEQVVSRYCHLNPQAQPEQLLKLINHKTKYLRWAGADLFYVTTSEGLNKIVVVEVNSCPSGQKSMPLVDENDEYGGYRAVIRDSFLAKLKGKRQVDGVLGVLYDKNKMEASGYAAAMAELTNEEVYLIPFFNDRWQELARYSKEKTLQVKIGSDWLNVRAAFRYVTQQPWDRIPVDCKTHIFNPVIACLAGGRNKLVAAKAYEIFNGELAQYGLKINVPHTIYDVAKMEIPLHIQTLGGRGVVKVPYSNAGQGVYTITNQRELDHFMELEETYDRYIVQSLIGNSSWTSVSPEGELFHVGTMPNKKNQIFVSDIRFMVRNGPQGFRPVGLYARRTATPLADQLSDGADSWSMLGTNLSIKEGKNEWSSDTSRLLLMDTRDFNKLGIGIDQLIEGYVQTLMSVIAIDNLAIQLINDKGRLKKKLFSSINKDDAFTKEFYRYPFES